MSDAIAIFDQKSLSYTYENNDWAFTNFFDGHTRISDVGARGTLHEQVTVTEVGEQQYFIAWEDEEMGPISQFVDMKKMRLWAAVKWEGAVEIWPAKITAFVDGQTS